MLMTADPASALRAAEKALEQTTAIVVAEHESLLDSYCTPPKDGHKPDPETINERWAYKAHEEYSAAVDAGREALILIRSTLAALEGEGGSRAVKCPSPAEAALEDDLIDPEYADYPTEADAEPAPGARGIQQTGVYMRCQCHLCEGKGTCTGECQMAVGLNWKPTTLARDGGAGDQTPNSTWHTPAPGAQWINAEVDGNRIVSVPPPHGTAEEVIEWALGGLRQDLVSDFLRGWQMADDGTPLDDALAHWPDYLTWLADKRRVSK